MYYNSNLYEADSYLVIIIECFCEEWTNTWNWLRGELVAEYKGWRREEQANQLIERSEIGWFVWLAGAQLHAEWNLFAFVFCFVGGLWPLPAAGAPPKEANKDKKQMNEWSATAGGNHISSLFHSNRQRQANELSSGSNEWKELLKWSNEWAGLACLCCGL